MSAASAPGKQALRADSDCLLHACLRPSGAGRSESVRGRMALMVVAVPENYLAAVRIRAGVEDMEPGSYVRMAGEGAGSWSWPEELGVERGY